MKKNFTLILIFTVFVCAFLFIGQKANADGSEYRYRLVDERTASFSFSGVWRFAENENYQGGGYYETSESGAVAEYSFEGAYSVTVVGSLADVTDAASLKITLDGTVYDNIEVTSASNGAIWSEDVSPERHSVRIETILHEGSRFRFDGLFLKMPEIGTIQTWINNDENVFTYNGFASLSGFCFTGEQNATVAYSFSGVNFKKIDIISERNIDSAIISIELNGVTIVPALDLKVSNNLGKTSVFTIEKELINEDVFALNTLVIKVLSASDSDRYFVFHGVNFYRYLSYEEEFDEDDYVLDLSDTEGLIVKRVERGANFSANGFTANENGGYSSETVGAEISYDFVGAGVQIAANCCETGGKADVYIDGEYCGLVNFYAATGMEKTVFSKCGLKEDRIHTFKMVVTDKKTFFSAGNKVSFAALNILKTSESIVDDDLDQFDLVFTEPQLKEDEVRKEMGLSSVKNGWNAVFVSVEGNNKRVLESSEKGSVISFSFRGTGVETIFITGHNKGKVNVYIDNVFVGLVSTRGEDGEEKAVFAICDLPLTVHSARIEVAGVPFGLQTVFSGYNVITKREDSENYSVIDQTDSNVSTNFSLNASSVYYNGSVSFSNLSGYAFEYRFRGTVISVYGNISLDGGVGTVYIDGEYKGTFNTRGTEKTSAPKSLLYVSDRLSENENHTLKIVVESKNNPILSLSYVAIDYFLVENYLPYLFPGYPPAPKSEYFEPVLELYPSMGSLYDNSREKTFNIGLITGVVAVSITVCVAGIVVLIIIFKKKRG